MKEFKGRVIAPGAKTLEAIVSHGGLNSLATFQGSVIKGSKVAFGSDQNNPDLFEKELTGKALCLPQTIGSTTGGLVIQTICAQHTNPAAFLFSKEIDSLAASGIVLAKVWEKSDVIAIDKLGDEFLEAVKTGDQVEIKEDGTVIVK